MAFNNTPKFLDPALMLSLNDYAIAFMIFNGLIWLDKNLQPQPDLAESWSSSDDLKTWTFKLKQGIKFQHGTPLTAEDVVYTFNRILDPDVGSPVSSVLAFIDGVEKIDDHTARFNLKTPNADTPTLLAIAHTRIVPHDLTGEQLEKEPAGTGPFKLEAFVPGDHVELVRNDSYWQDGLPYLDRIRYLFMPEEATQIAALTGGSIDMMYQLGIENIPTIESDPETVPLPVRSGNYQDIVMRVSEEPFTDNRVRMAMKLCVDRPGMQQAVLQGRGDLGNDHPIPPVNPYYAQDIPLREQNVAQAKQLLADAGYEDGLDVTFHTSSVRSGFVEQAVTFQEMAKEAGINVNIERVPPDVYWSEYWMKVPLCMSQWSMRATADEILTVTMHSDADWNESDYKNPELDQLIETARGEKDEDKRKELYAEAQHLIRDDGGIIVSYFRPIVMARRKEVQNFTAHPSHWLDFKQTWIAQDG
jgi:peptide/nickel transport system substrate-binding protein